MRSLTASHLLCALCSNERECSCDTWDHLHETGCEINGVLCECCRESEVDRIPDGPEPDPYLDHVKELSVVDLDALIVEFPTLLPPTLPWIPTAA